MASAKFLEEALSTDVDESAVSALVGSLENQLVTSAPPLASYPTGIPQHQNHNTVGGGAGGGLLSNGGTPSNSNSSNPDKQTIIPNGELDNHSKLTGTIITGAAAQAATGTVVTFANEIDKTCTFVTQTAMSTAAGPVLTRAAFPNGALGLPVKQPTLVIKTTGGAPGLVTVPMNAATTTTATTGIQQQAANNVGTTQSSANILSNLQVVNVRAGVVTQGQKGQTARVVLGSTPPPGTPQLTLQSLHGLQPGQQGHLLLKTENGQYQLLRVGPAPAVTAALTPSTAPGTTAPLTFRMQTVPTQVATQQVTTPTSVATSTSPTGATAQKPVNENTKEKCRKFLANLLDLSSKEPRSVERSVKTLIQELIDMRVEPEDFCDRLERLLNASPQPCLIGFLKKSLPLLRHAMVTKEVIIDGIRPPPPNVVFSIVAAAPSQQIRPVVSTSQIRLVAPGGTPTAAAVIRPGQVLQQRLVTPVRGTVQQQATRVTGAPPRPTIVGQISSSSNSPPALHPVVFPNGQVRTGANAVVRQPLQVRSNPTTAAVPGGGSVLRTPLAIAGANPPSSSSLRSGVASARPSATTGNVFKNHPKPLVPSSLSKPLTKDKKMFSSAAAAAAYAGDDDINDVAAMGGVNLAEETQRILGSTEFVGTQIRSCKEEYALAMGPLQHRIKLAMLKQGLDEPGNEVAAVVAHGVQERLKNLLEKLSVITEHRLEMVKSDQRYEVTSEIKGQLKFLEDLDRAERKRHEELEREMLLRAAKSRSRTEDPEQAKLKAKAKEMQRVEMEELRQREANATALQAIGPRKKPRLEGESNVGALQSNSSSGFGGSSRSQVPLRARAKKATLRDVQHLFESEKDLCKSTLLFKSYLK